jgi:two-component system, cell cycle sensor histidine kinase PleC
VPAQRSISISTRDAAFTVSQRLFGHLRGCALAFVRSVHPRPEDLWLTEAQLRLIRAGTRNSPLLIPFGALFVSMACAPWKSLELRTTWWLAVSAICLALYFVGNHLDRLPANSLANVRYRARCYMAMTLLFNAAWCSMSVFLWAPGAEINHMMLILILACSLAGSLSLAAGHPGTAAAVLLIHVSYMVAPALLRGTPLDATLASLSVVFACLMAGQVAALNAGTNKMLRLEHERAGMIEGLQRAKTESDRDRERAATAGRAKSQFLSNMNHELRTPMNAILGFSELITSKAFGRDVEKYTEYAKIIHDSGQHLLCLINDMLDLAKIEGGRLSLKEGDVDLARLIGDAVASTEARAKDKQIALSKTVERGLPHLYGDEQGLLQIVNNLLSNALKFTPDGGRVSVFAHSEADGSLAFGVEDNGVGIASEDQAHVFERFGVGRHDVTMDNRGTGLGLAIVKGFAEAHDGHVALQSELGSGTRVTVTLPKERVKIVRASRSAVA